MYTYSPGANHHANNHLHDIESAQQALGGIGRSTLYLLLRTGELGSVKIGRRRLVPQSQIDAFIARRTHTRAGGDE